MMSWRASSATCPGHFSATANPERGTGRVERPVVSRAVIFVTDDELARIVRDLHGQLLGNAEPVTQARAVAPGKFDHVSRLAVVSARRELYRAREHVLFFVIDEAACIERGEQTGDVGLHAGQGAQFAVGAAQPGGARAGRRVRLASF